MAGPSWLIHTVRPDQAQARRVVPISPTLSKRITRSLHWRGFGGTLRQLAADSTALLDLPWLLLSHLLPGPPNAREFRVFALQRSGQHAFVQWMIKNSPGRVVFLNHCAPDDSPLLTCAGPHITHGFLSHRYVARRREANGKHSKKGTLIYNYENLRLDPDVVGHMNRMRREWVGESARSRDVLLLRDPFNLFASVLRWRRQNNPNAGGPALSKARTLWKNYAREYARETQLLQDPILITYNEWFSSESYRGRLARELDLTTADRGLDQVAPWGPATWGASFDGLALDGHAREMRVLDRWRQYEDDPIFRRQFDDGEVWRLSERIFGHLPGTEALHRDAGAPSTSGLSRARGPGSRRTRRP